MRNIKCKSKSFHIYRYGVINAACRGRCESKSLHIHRYGAVNTPYSKIKKGSLTVEAACVIPLVLLTIITVLSVCFFVHNRAWLTAAACEAALYGSAQGEKGGDAAAAQATARGELLAREIFLGTRDPEMSVTAQDKIEVVYHLVSKDFGTGYLLSAFPEGKAVLLSASDRLRTYLAEKENTGS